MGETDRVGGRRLRWLLVTALAVEVVAFVGLLAARRAVVPVVAWQERQWSEEASGGKPRVELLTRHPRVRSPYYGFYFRPGDLIVEWSGFFDLADPSRVAVRLLSTARAEMELAGRTVASVPAAGMARAQPSEGRLELPAGPVEIRVRARLEYGRGSLRGWMARGTGEWVPLEDLRVTPRAQGSEAISRAAEFRRWLDPVLVGAGVVGLLLIALLLRSTARLERRLAEGAASCLLLAGLMLPHHGPGLAFWGSAWWSSAQSPMGLALVLLGLLPWVLCLVRPRWVDASARALDAFRGSPLAVAGVALALTWLLREQRVWGDGWMTIDLLSGRLEHPFGVFFWKEPLDRWITVAAARAAAPLGIDARSVIAGTSCLAGAWAAWTLSHHHRLGELRLAEVAAVSTAGAALLFFGHIEHYSWVTAALLAFLLAARHVEQRPLKTGVLGGLALAFHAVAVLQVVPVLAASLLAFLHTRTLRNATAPAPTRVRFIIQLIGGALVVPSLLVIAAVAAGIPLPEVGFNQFADDPAVLLGPAAALSPDNVVKVANRAVMILSPGILLGLLLVLAALPALLITRYKELRHLESAAPQEQRTAFSPAQQLVLVAAVAGALVHLVFLEGKVRPDVIDWDLYAPAYVPLALVAGQALARAGDRATRAWAVGVSASLLILALM